ncbi:MAG: hypothetical protein ACI9N1_002618 [Flavobacteriales bacterium]|jgi:hypothetical protein
MKIIIFLIITFGTLNSLAQVIEIPINDVKWVNSRTVDYSSPPSYYYYEYNYSHYCMYGEDSIYNFLLYTKIEDCNNQNYIGCFRNDNGISYFLPKDSVQEYVVYDFTKSLGDTIFDVYYLEHGVNNQIEDLVLTAIDSTLIGSEYRLVYSFSNRHSWIEGVGGTQGFLWDSFQSLGHTSSELICHSYGDSIMQDPNNVIVGGCDNSLSNKKTINEINLNLYPNPASNFLSIETDELKIENIPYQIFNSVGQLSQSGIFKENLIDISKLTSGYYTISLIVDNQRYHSTLVLSH